MKYNSSDPGMSQKWKDRFQYGAAGFLIATAVALAFISFIITLTVGSGVIAWGGLSMGTALALIGGGMFFHNQLVTFEINANRKIEEMSNHVEEEIKHMNNYNKQHREKPVRRAERYIDRTDDE